MALISLNSVRKSFGGFDVLDEVTFTIGASEKVALVGPNGSGKTTILRMIVGQDDADSGTVQVIGGTSIGFMPQDSELTGGGDLVEEVSNATTEIKHLERELRRLESAMSAGDTASSGGRGSVRADDPAARTEPRPPDDAVHEMEALIAEYGEVQHEFERLGGYAFDAEVKSTLSGLGLGPEHWEKPVTVLSGGQKTRAALAKLLLQKPDVLLLDEPTNHLDIEACEWLEEFLQDFSGAVFVVSHDRYFLDRVVTKVVDLHEGFTRSYPGNYTAYARQKEEVLRQQAESYDRQQAEIAKLTDFISRYHAGQRHREAKSRGRTLDKMVRVRKPRMESEKIHVRLDAGSSSGHIVLDLQDVAKGFDGKTLFTGLNLLVENGDRIGLVGPNGSGKTTLLRMILGDEEPSAGTVSIGYGVEMGYFAQDLAGLDPENTVLEELLESADLKPGEARNLLARFLFRGDDVFKSVARLSGGERNRLVLAKLMLQKPNLLLLDEPTNHLDIDSRQALDQALKEFAGTVILTSHDRYLLNSVATRIVEIANGASKVFEGNYDFFVERARSHRTRIRPAKKKPKPKPVATSGPKGPNAADYEREIEATEARLGELTDLLGRPETYADGAVAAATQAEYHEVASRIEQLYAEWEQALGD